MVKCPRSETLMVESSVATLLGKFQIEACQKGVHRIVLPEVLDEMFPVCDEPVSDLDVASDHENGTIKLVSNWIHCYFNAPEDILSRPLPPRCYPPKAFTEFQISVWNKLAESCHFGEVISYQDLAIRLGKPKASRAVGTALKNNPIGILVPCHRVIRSNGVYGQYAGGKKNGMKEWLLKYEGSKNDGLKIAT